MVLVDFQIALRNLVKHTRRTLFLVSAIALVTALLIALQGLIGGMRQSVVQSATALLTGHVNVGGFYKITPSSAASLLVDYERVVARIREHTPGIESLVIRSRGSAKVISDANSMDLVIGGVHIDAESRFRKSIPVATGNLEQLREPGTIMLFEDQASRLRVAVGDSVTLSARTLRGAQNAVDVRVVAIARSVGLISAICAYVSHQTLNDLIAASPDTTSVIQLYLKHPSSAPRVAAALRGDLASAGFPLMPPDPTPYWQKLSTRIGSEDWTGQRLDVTTWEDEMSNITPMLTALQVLASLLVFVLMGIVAIGIFNTLAIALRERTREIGTLRALGMQRLRVLRLFLLEAALLGASGTMIGALVGAGIALTIGAMRLSVPEGARLFLMQQHVTVAIDIQSAAIDAVVLTCVTTIAALVPAFRASRLAPVTAMHGVA